MAKKSKASTEKQPSWNQGDDAKLRNLFIKGLRQGGVDSEVLDRKTINSIQQRYWSERNNDTFAPLYRRKAREFNLNKSLQGQRSAQGKGEYI